VCGPDTLLIAEEEAAHKTIGKEIQRYADAGQIEVSRWSGYSHPYGHPMHGDGHAAVFLDETGQVVGQSYSRLSGQIRTWERDEIRQTENADDDTIRIWLRLTSLPEGKAFAHLEWPDTVDEDRFEITIRREFVHDEFETRL
jgi:hypothetical protein